MLGGIVNEALSTIDPNGLSSKLSSASSFLGVPDVKEDGAVHTVVRVAYNVRGGRQLEELIATVEWRVDEDLCSMLCGEVDEAILIWIIDISPEGNVEHLKETP